MELIERPELEEETVRLGKITGIAFEIWRDLKTGTRKRTRKQGRGSSNRSNAEQKHE